MIDVRCPACGQMTSIHSESVAVGMEVICRQCGAILSVETVHPVVLAAIDFEEDD